MLVLWNRLNVIINYVFYDNVIIFTVIKFYQIDKVTNKLLTLVLKLYYLFFFVV